MLFFLLLIIISIFLINSTASSGLSTFFGNSSTPLLSICSDNRDSRNFSNIWFLLDFVFLVPSDPINYNNKNCQFLSTKFLSVFFRLFELSFFQFCSNFVQILFKFCSNFVQILWTKSWSTKFLSVLLKFCELSSYQLSFCQFYHSYNSQLRLNKKNKVMVAALDTPQQKIRAVLTLYKPYLSKQSYFNSKKIMKIDSL